jgi:hypothetical protein
MISSMLWLFGGCVLVERRRRRVIARTIRSGLGLSGRRLLDPFVLVLLGAESLVVVALELEQLLEVRLAEDLKDEENKG